MLDKADADVVVLLETTSAWEENLAPLRKKYTFVTGTVNEVGYGMTIYSKLAGFYNTFSAHNFLMQWPLDHVFVTKHFALKKLKLFDNAGSDHYPVFVELIYNK